MSVDPNSVDSDCKISMFQSDQLSETINSIVETEHQINTTPDHGDTEACEEPAESQRVANDNLTINIQIPKTP